MHEQDLAVIKSLVPVAWADGVFAEREREMLSALLDAYNASDHEKEQLLKFAAEPRTLEDIPLQDLSHGDRRVVLQHAVVLSHVDGAQAPAERDLLQRLAQHLRIPTDEAKVIFETASERAKRYLGLLQQPSV